MKLKVRLDSGNAAVTGPDGLYEAARLLRQTADRIEAGQDYGRLVDYNGNGVGSWELEQEADE